MALPEVELPYEGTFADPTGPKKEFAYIGEQGTFLERRDDLLATTLRSLPHLMHHVPLPLRGPYKVVPGEQQLGERVHQSGYALCNGIVGVTNNRGEPNPANRSEAPIPCKGKAVNRSGYCSKHGGMLHPLDRKRIDWENAPREIKFKFGKLSVEELDDEELSRGQIRKADGKFTKNGYVSSEIHDKMVRELFKRSDEMLQENLLTAVSTFAEIAKGTAYEPADRLKAAEFIFTRLRGKVPTEVKVTQEKPFEMVLTDVMTGGSRAESRRQRGIDEGTIDAEFIEEIADLDPGIDLDEGQEVEEVEEEYVPEDHIPLRADWLPKKPKLTGPAGRTEEASVPPSDMEYRTVYEKQKEENERKAEEERIAFAENAKLFKKEMQRRKNQRYAVRAEGYSDLPKPYGMVALDAEDEGEKTIKFVKPEGS